MHEVKKERDEWGDGYEAQVLCTTADDALFGALPNGDDMRA